MKLERCIGCKYLDESRKKPWCHKSDRPLQQVKGCSRNGKVYNTGYYEPRNTRRG